MPALLILDAVSSAHEGHAFCDKQRQVTLTHQEIDSRMKGQHCYCKRFDGLERRKVTLQEHAQMRRYRESEMCGKLERAGCDQEAGRGNDWMRIRLATPS